MQSAISISFRFVIIGTDSNVVRIPVVEVFLIETMLMPVRIRLFFDADPDLELVPIRNYDIL